MNDYDNVVRVTIGEHELRATTRTLLLLLQSAGSLAPHRDDVEGICFDVLPPPDVDSKVWANTVVEAFTHYGYEAERAVRQPTPRRCLLTSTSDELADLASRVAATEEWGQHCLR